MNHNPDSPGPPYADDFSIGQASNRLKASASADLFRHVIDQQYGGLEDRYADLSEALQSLGYQSRDPGLILAINAHIWGSVFPLFRFADDIQKQRWLPALVEGSLFGGHAITEPHAGSDAGAMQTHFQQSGDGFILNGHKRFITNTPIAGLMIVYAHQQGSQQISAFIVLADDPGVRFESGPTVVGCRTATMGDILLQDCSLPADRLLGKMGAGSSMIQLALELERAFIFSGISGVMRWQLEEVVRFARSRSSGRGKLGRHQAISHKIAEMSLRLDTTELWIKRCAAQLDQKKRITVASAQTKLYASEAFLQSTLDFVHIMGAQGLQGEFTRLVEDAMAGRLMSGSSELQKNIIAAMLGLPMDDVFSN